MDGIAYSLFTASAITLENVDRTGTQYAGLEPVKLVIPKNTCFDLHKTYESQLINPDCRDVARELTTYTTRLGQYLVIALTPTRYDLYKKLNQSMASGMRIHAIIQDTFVDIASLMRFDLPEHPTVLSAGLVSLVDDIKQEYPSFLKLGVLY